MGIDYYAILDVSRDATNIEIKLAYRKWASIAHPDYKVHQCDVTHPEALSPSRPCAGVSNECYWFLLNEAYDVLVDPFFREIFDLFGEEGLKKGVATKNGYFPGYTYHGDCRKTYENVFGSYSPYADIIDAVTNPPPLARMPEGGICPKKKDADREHLIYVDLKEVFYGCTKKMKILRREFVDDMENETKIKERYLVVSIKPGIMPGTTFRYTEQGDQGIGIIPADIVFIIAEKKHKVYTREGPHLHITKSITLREALCGTKVSITTIDNRPLMFTINDVIHPDYCHGIEEEGLPYPNDCEKKGDIHVHFNVEYPKYVPKLMKTQLANLLEQLEHEETIKEESIMERMNNVAKLLLRQKIEKENAKVNREI